LTYKKKILEVQKKLPLQEINARLRAKKIEVKENEVEATLRITENRIIMPNCARGIRRQELGLRKSKP
jgi:hypothetical protein